jgi:hypothetical protein
MDVEILDKVPAGILSQSPVISSSSSPTSWDQKRVELINKLEERAVALQTAGLGRGLLFQTIVDGLKATKDIYSTTGKVVASEPDHNVRAKFVAVAVEVLGEKAKEEGGSKIPQMIVILPNGERV